MGKLLDVLLVLFLLFVVFFLLSTALPLVSKNPLAFTLALPKLPQIPSYPSGSSSGNGDIYDYYGDSTASPSGTEVYGFERIAQEIRSLRSTGGLSPYQTTTNLYVNRSGSADPGNEYVTMRFQKTGNKKILLTGWRIESDMTGRGATIGKGVNFPFLGGINYDEPIWINPGDTVYLVSGRSPNGISFHSNKCTGYFEQFQDFTPPLEQNCPRVTDDLPRAPNRLPDRCLNYIDNLPTCRIPLENNLNSNLSPECLSFLSTEINYNKCIDRHRTDPDFYKPEWHIYLNQNESIWKTQREVIKLFDNDGKTVGVVSY